MPEGLLLIDDDGGEPFWVAAKWPLQELEFSAVAIASDFRTVDEAVVKARDAMAVHEGEEFHWHVVTDGHFGANRDGGVELLEQLKRHGPGAWKRAVIYSIDPSEVDRFPEDCWAIVRRLGAESGERERILRLLLTGRAPNLEDLGALVDDLREVIYACDAVSGSTAHPQAMMAYAQPAVAVADAPSVGLLRAIGASPKLFSWETKATFGDETERRFVSGLTAFYRGRPPEDPARTWEYIVGCLDPLQSLSPASGGRLRLLWETLQTGGDAGLLEKGHPLLTSDNLKALRRAVVRMRLTTLGRQISNMNDPGAFRGLCREALEEGERLVELVQCAAAGEDVVAHLHDAMASGFSFEGARRHLSHRVLKDLFDRLCSSDEEWSLPQRPLEERVKLLTDNWEQIRAQPSARTAGQMYREASADFGPPSAALEAMISGAHAWHSLKPTKAFPKSVQALDWLAAIDLVASRLDDPTTHWELAEIERFWRCAIELTDFLAALQPADPRFWEYFA